MIINAFELFVWNCFSNTVYTVFVWELYDVHVIADQTWYEHTRLASVCIWSKSTFENAPYGPFRNHGLGLGLGLWLRQLNNRCMLSLRNFKCADGKPSWSSSRSSSPSRAYEDGIQIEYILTWINGVAHCTVLHHCTKSCDFLGLEIKSKGYIN